MDIAIIGSGIAGVMAASILYSKGFKVTVYEKEDLIGGHARTLKVPIETGDHLLVELGTMMHDPKYIHPRINQYIKELGIPINEFPLTFSFDNPKNKLSWSTQSRFTGFLRDLAVLAEVVKNSSSNVAHNLFFLKELHQYLDLMPQICSEEKYRHMNLKEFIKQENFSERFVENWLLPQALCWWGVTKEYAMSTSIQVMTESFYLVSQTPQYYFPDGWSAFVETILAPFKHRIRAGCTVESVKRTGNGVKLVVEGQHKQYDEVIFATPPSVVSSLLKEQTIDEDTILSSFETVKTKVYLHSDSNWMPKDEEWSTINLIQDDKGSYSTYWCGIIHPDKPHIFLSWGDHLTETPKQSTLLETTEWLRTLPTVAYIDACRQINRLQGHGNIWYCGAHVHTLDTGYKGATPSLWHENAFRSGLSVAERIISIEKQGRGSWKKKLTT